MEITYRRAAPEELSRVEELMNDGNLDARDLRAEDILVAVVDGMIVGINRLRRYSDGGIEIASAYVVPTHREHGINRRLTEMLRDECSAPAYIITHPSNEAYVGKMGFVRVTDRARLPKSIADKVDWCRARYQTHEPGVFVFDP